MVTQFQLIELNSWNDVPVDLPVRVYLGTLDDARKRFKERYGYDCQVAYRLRDQWLLVMDKDYEVEVEK
jgi:hypothetical protein